MAKISVPKDVSPNIKDIVDFSRGCGRVKTTFPYFQTWVKLILTIHASVDQLIYPLVFNYIGFALFRFCPALVSSYYKIYIKNKRKESHIIEIRNSFENFK